MSTQTPAWWLVTRREVLAKITDKSFLIGTLVTVAIIIAFMGVQAAMESTTDKYTLAATPEAVEMARAVEAGASDVVRGVEVEVEVVADADAAKAALADDDVDVWLHPGGDGWVLTWESSEESDLATAVQMIVGQTVVAANADRAGTTLAALNAGAAVTTELLEGDVERAMVADFVGFAFAFLFYLAAMLFGYQLAYSVIEEKQSRIVEIIAAAIPLRHLLAGKILGNTVLALLQMTIYVVVALVGMAFTPYREHIGAISGPAVWFIAFFVAGFIALSCLWAVAGALASRSEDLQATGTPLMMLIMGIFFGAVILDGRAEHIGSFVPPLSAVIMPKRLVTGDAAWWEAVLALGLLGLLTALTVWIGERLYRRALMQSGGRVSLRQAWVADD